MGKRVMVRESRRRGGEEDPSGGGCIPYNFRITTVVENVQVDSLWIVGSIGKFVTFRPREYGKPDVSGNIFEVESSCRFLLLLKQHMIPRFSQPIKARDSNTIGLLATQVCACPSTICNTSHWRNEKLGRQTSLDQAYS